MSYLQPDYATLACSRVASIGLEKLVLCVQILTIHSSRIAARRTSSTRDIASCAQCGLSSIHINFRLMDSG